LFQVYTPRKILQAIEDFIELLKSKKSVQKIIVPAIAPVQHFPSIPWAMRFFLGMHRSILAKELKFLQKSIPELDFNNFDFDMSHDLLASDGIHPSDKGYEMMAKATLSSLKNSR
jgi:lysophospholipase L1-like esterase